MLEEKTPKQRSEDHDLLIKLDTRFGIFEKTMAEMTATLHAKFEKVFSLIEKKADKEDVREIKKEIKYIDTRVKSVEDKQETQEAKKQTLIDIGNMGVKGWGILIGGVSFCIMIIEWIKN